MLDRNEFLKKYGIEELAFEKSGWSWDALTAVHQDHTSRVAQLQLTGSYIADRLRQVEAVHSLKFRVKDPEHVVEKLIRKGVGDPPVTRDTYRERLTDLVGVRALHLFKEDWPAIHDEVVGAWDLHETPVANVRKGDPEEMTRMFSEKGCRINEHPFGYRSVHYIVKSQPSKEIVLAEVQVRTIFEEGWSEIDHRIRYPYDLENIVLTQFLVIFNRLAGNADEMGSFIRFLKVELESRESRYGEATSAYEKIEHELKTQIEALEITKKEKDLLEKRVRQLAEKARETTTALTSDRYRLTLDAAHGMTAEELEAAQQRWRLVMEQQTERNRAEMAEAVKRLMTKVKEMDRRQKAKK